MCVSMDKSKKRILGTLLGYVIGLIWGFAMDNMALGLVMGTAMAVPLGKSLAGEELIQDKATRRRVVFITTLSMAIGCIAYGFIAGDMRSGIGAAIGLSFVVGLKGEKLFDERLANVFNKATRDAFLTANVGFSYVGFFHELLDAVPAINLIPVMERFIYVLFLSWAVFLISWLYHYYWKGE
jgi:hypothetical protein